MRFSSQPTALMVACLIGVLLSGCLTKDGPETRFYVLGQLPAQVDPLPNIPHQPPLSVAVTSLRLPRYLERPQIVTRVGANRLEFAEYHQWGGNLSKNMMRALAANLSQLLATSEVSISGGRPVLPDATRIEIDIIHFERVPNGKVELSAQWRVYAPKTDVPALTRITHLNSEKEVAATDMDGIVATMSDQFGELSRTIASAVVALSNR
ncbi:MAG: hypothetical protein DRQ37_02175 [Gammaproteobacteria bacterium]|nr:MAG: hypothetical protein DRQ37_02175 [Gammaproteobacteria bacterium]